MVAVGAGFEAEVQSGEEQGFVSLQASIATVFGSPVQVLNRPVPGHLPVVHGGGHSLSGGGRRIDHALEFCLERKALRHGGRVHGERPAELLLVVQAQMGVAVERRADLEGRG